MKEQVAKRKDVIHVALTNQSRQRRRAEKEDIIGRDNKHSISNQDRWMKEGSPEGVEREVETRPELKRKMN